MKTKSVAVSTGPFRFMVSESWDCLHDHEDNHRSCKPEKYIKFSLALTSNDLYKRSVLGRKVLVLLKIENRANGSLHHESASSSAYSAYSAVCASLGSSSLHESARSACSCKLP